MGEIKSKNFIFGINICLLIILFFVANNVRFWDQDEAAYAGFALNMLQEKSTWSIPFFDWSFPHRKPPFLFWCISFFYSIFGINEFSTRLITVLSSGLTLFIIYKHLLINHSLELAKRSILLLGSSFLFLIYTKIAFTDGVLLLFETVCLLKLVQVLQAQKSTIHWSIFWLCASLGVLLKGPAILIPLGIFAVLILIFYFKDLKRIFSALHFFKGLLIFIVPISLWVYSTILEDKGEFIQWIYDWYVKNRADKGVWGQTGPPGYYVVLYTLSFLPFLGLLFGISKKDSKLFLQNKGYLFAFISTWLIFEILVSKLPSYAIGAIPFIAVFLAKISFNENKKSQLFSLAYYFSVLNFSLYFKEIDGINLMPITFISLSILLIQLFLYLNNKLSLSFQFSSHLMLLIFIFAFPFNEFCSKTDGTKEISEYISKNFPENKSIVLIDDFGKPPSLPLYLTLNGYQIKYDSNKILSKEIVISSTLLDSSFVLKNKITHRFVDRNSHHTYYISQKK